jgi:hypothetical protein
VPERRSPQVCVSNTLDSWVLEPATCSQTACDMSAQSMPTTAANAWVIRRAIITSYEINHVSVRGRADVLRKQYSEPGVQQTLGIRWRTPAHPQIRS